MKDVGVIFLGLLGIVLSFYIVIFVIYIVLYIIDPALADSFGRLMK